MEEDHLPKPEYDHPTRDVVIILAVFFEFGLAPLSLILGWLLGQPPLETFEWSANAGVVGNLGHDSADLGVRGHAPLADRPARPGQGVLRQRSRAALEGECPGRTSPWFRYPPAWARRCSFAACSRLPLPVGCNRRLATGGECPAGSASRASSSGSAIRSRCPMP